MSEDLHSLSGAYVLDALTEQERADFGARLEELVGEMIGRPPREGTRPYALASVVVPRPVASRETS